MNRRDMDGAGGASPLLPAGHRTLRFLTKDPSFIDGRPAFSPDGESVLFMWSPAAKQGESTFWIVPSAGGKAEPFYSGEKRKPRLQATRPDWSRTRQSFGIAFTGIEQGRSELWLLDASTKQVRKVPLPAGGEGGSNVWSYPSWYGDGELVAVTNYRDLVHQIVKADLDGHVQPLTESSTVWAGMSSVSAGTANQGVLAFAGEKPVPQPPSLPLPFPDCQPDGYCQDLNQIWIRRPGEASYPIDGMQGRAPWWSPDGNFIAFESNRDSAGKGHYLIFVHSVREGWTVSVTPENLNVQHAKWSPDGRELVFAADLEKGGAGIVIMNLF